MVRYLSANDYQDLIAANNYGKLLTFRKLLYTDRDGYIWVY